MFESTALRRPPAGTDTDLYPLLTLHHCTITRYRRSQPETFVDLSLVSELGPFRARGSLLLPLPRKHRSLLLLSDPAPPTVDIIIPKVETYSIEQLANGAIVIWILGAAAWYKVCPALEYGAVHRKMVEKATVWMWLQGWMEAAARADVWDSMSAAGLAGSRRGAKKVVGGMARWLGLQMCNPEHRPEEWRETEVWREIEDGFPEVAEEVTRFYSASVTTRSKKESKKAASSTTTTAARSTRSRKRTRPETPPPDPEESSDEEMEDESEDEEDDEEEEEHTPTSRPPSDPTAPFSPRGKTISSKGRSILRPRSSTFPLASPSPDEDSFSPIRTRPRRPREPRDSLRWQCGKCDYEVANARTREGRGEVERHYATHGQVFSKALETVELEAGSAESGVRNLLNKLREMEQVWEESRPSPLKGLGE